MILKEIERFKYAFTGLFHALTRDRAFAINFFGGGLVVALVIYFLGPLSNSEMLFIGLAWVLILVTEMQNTAFETALDKLHPQRHEDIGKSKDMASASVLLAGFFALFVVLVIAFT